jgi:hypothetical protein
MKIKSDRPEIFGIVKHLDRWIDKFFLDLTIFIVKSGLNPDFLQFELQFKLKIELIFDLN